MLLHAISARPTRGSNSSTEEIVYDSEDKLLILAVIEYALFDYRRAFDIPTKENIAVAKSAHAWLTAKYDPFIECSLAFWCDLLFADPRGMYARIKRMAKEAPPVYCGQRLAEIRAEGKVTQKKAKTYTRGTNKPVGRPSTKKKLLDKADNEESQRDPQEVSSQVTTHTTTHTTIMFGDFQRGGSLPRSYSQSYRQLASPRAVIKHRRKAGTLVTVK